MLLGRQTAHVLVSLLLMWEIRLVFLAPGFGLAQDLTAAPLWSKLVDGQSLFFLHSSFQINIKKKKLETKNLFANTKTSIH